MEESRESEGDNRHEEKVRRQAETTKRNGGQSRGKIRKNDSCSARASVN